MHNGVAELVDPGLLHTCTKSSQVLLIHYGSAVTKVCSLNPATLGREAALTIQGTTRAIAQQLVLSEVDCLLLKYTQHGNKAL